MTPNISQPSPPNSQTSRSTSPGLTIYTPSSEDPRQNYSLAPRRISRRPSPLRPVTSGEQSAPVHRGSFSSDEASISCQQKEEETMDTRPPLHRPTDGRSQVPLLRNELKDERGRTTFVEPNGSGRPAFTGRRSTFRSRSPDMAGSAATKRKYLYASFFLILSLIAFVVQTETAEYIQNKLGWKKPYAML